MIDLDALEQLASTATAGPWWIDSHGHEMVNPESMELVFRTDNSMGELARSEETGNLSRWPNDNDATFIASFNPDVAIELITRLRQAEKDAARYRWLRDSAVDLDWTVDGEDKTHVDITVWHNDGFDSANYGIDATPEEVDSIIDKEMQCSGGNK